VFDLGRMRDDAFVRKYVPFLERYGMHDQEALNCYFGGERGELPPEWNHLVVQEFLDEPKVVHWAGSVKPWDPGVTAFQDRWRDYRRRVDARAATLA
jgi:lipopolysaccharide biosynthesis glycosyltransferase